MKQANLSSGLAVLLAVMAAPMLAGCAATVSDTADGPVLTSDGEEAVDGAQDALHNSGCGFGGYNGHGSSHIGYVHGPGSYGYGNLAGAYGLGGPGGYGFGSGLGGYGSNPAGYGHSYGNGFGGFGTCRL